MPIIVNPGSSIGPANTDSEWSNTVDTARRDAEEWLVRMQYAGMTDVELLDSRPREVDGRWVFTFRHKVTGVEVELETHGIDDLDAYLKDNIFTPRVYWNGSSTGDPCLDDFKADGFKKLVTWIPE